MINDTTKDINTTIIIIVIIIIIIINFFTFPIILYIQI